MKPFIAMLILTFATFSFVNAQEEYLPVPESAGGVPIDPEKGYYLGELGGGLYFVTEGVYQAMFYVTDEGVVLIDAPPTLTEAIPAAIAEVTEQPITHFIYSHSHGDHVGSAGQFISPDTEIIAQEETYTILSRENDSERPLPTLTFEETYILNVGGAVLRLHYFGNNHEPGNILIYAPKQKALMLVDVVWPGWSPFAELGYAQDIPGFIAYHDYALSFDFDTFVGGHLGRPGTREDVETSKQYMNDLREVALTALQSVDPFQVAQTQNVPLDNPWAIFGAYLEEVSAQCADAITEQWGGRLAAVDVFSETNCDAMVLSVRVDENGVGRGFETLSD